MPNNPLACNPYKTKTEGNFKKTHALSTESQGKLNHLGTTDPEILGLSVVLQPSSTLVATKYIAWYVAKHFGMSSTIQQHLVEDAMPANVKKLETAVLSEYDEGSPTYTTIFSKPKSYLYDNVNQQEKLINLKTVSEIIAGFLPLAPAKVVFDVYLKSFEDNLMASLKAQTNLTKASTEIDEARITWCDEALGVTGSLLKKYNLTPEKIEDIFDLSMFNTPQSHVDPDKGTTLISAPIDSILAANMVYDPLKTYYIHNSGLVALKVGSASAFDVLVLQNAITFQIDETKIVSGAELGDILNRYLIIVNESTELPGELRIKEVIPEA